MKQGWPPISPDYAVCSRCGVRFAPGSCSCGALLTSASIWKVYAARKFIWEATRADAKKSRRNKWLMLMAAEVAIVIAALAAVHFWMLP